MIAIAPGRKARPIHTPELRRFPPAVQANRPIPPGVARPVELRAGRRPDGPATGKRPIRAKPRRRFPPEVLSPAEVAALLAACGPQADPYALRHRALIATLYRSGLRIREALALRPKDLELDRGAIRVLQAKGGASRTVGIDAGGAAMIRQWLARRAGLGIGGLAPVFCSLSGRSLSTAYIRRLLKRLGRQAQIERRVHAHGLRHTHAAELRAEGMDIGIICKQLGHRSIATTARYLDHIAPVAVVEAIAKRSW